MEPVYRRRYGPPNASFDYRGIHVVTLDSSRWETYGADAARSSSPGSPTICSATRARPARSSSMHKPLWFRGVAAGQPDPLHALFVRTGVDAVFTGHYHQYLSGDYDGIRYTSVGSSGGATDDLRIGPMYHFTWVTVDREGSTSRRSTPDPSCPGRRCTAAEFHALEDRLNTGLRFPEPFRVPVDLAPAASPISLIVDNPAARSPSTTRCAGPCRRTGPSIPRRRRCTSSPAPRRRSSSRSGAAGKLYPVPTVDVSVPVRRGQDRSRSRSPWPSRGPRMRSPR